LIFFKRFFRDDKQGGYFSHIDPVTLDPRAESLGHNRAKKNWNSVGDHAPAFLINLVLATGRQEPGRLPGRDGRHDCRPFPRLREQPVCAGEVPRGLEQDQTWGWQQNRAVIGHNLKIAWNLMRINALAPKEEYVALARKIADIMPWAGEDRQRGGWYDVVERILGPDEKFHRYAWHDRKAWWQQEQAILAYLILHGCVGEESTSAMRANPRPFTTPTSSTIRMAAFTSTCSPTAFRSSWALNASRAATP